MEFERVEVGADHPCLRFYFSCPRRTGTQVTNKLPGGDNLGQSPAWGLVVSQEILSENLFYLKSHYFCGSTFWGCFEVV